jgi:hypothetical protein
MREMLLTAVTTATILLAGPLGAKAMSLVIPAALDVAAARTAHVQEVVNVCGTNGCVPVQTKRVRHTRPGSVAAQHI